MKRLPVVAILGRPNVGKSTLFNRIIRKRDAIVDDTSGVTRDRKYQKTDWAGVDFELMDTGGYVPGSNDLFEKVIRQQVELAINEADVIVFLLDVTTGITSLDLDIANTLQRCENPVITVVNKVDNELRENELGEFYKLGLGEPVAISAISGRNIGDFLDILIDTLPQKVNWSESEDECIRLAIIGRPNVGKSSYANAVLGENKLIVTDIPGTTRDAIDTRVRYKNRELLLIDTAGLRKKARVKEQVEYFSTVRTHNAIRKCDIAIVLIDAAESFADQDKKIIHTAVEEGKGVVLGVNKWDLIEKDTRTASVFEKNIRYEIREMSYIPVMFISVERRQRIFRLMDVALSIYDESGKRIPTRELNNLLRESIEKNHPPAYGRKWVKINYMTQTRIHPPGFTFFTNEPEGIRQNYRNYLENQIRTRHGFMGVPIRLHFRKKN